MLKLIFQFARFGIVGVICFAVDFLLMVLLTEAFSLPYLLSSGISFLISTALNYFLSVRFVYKARENIGRTLRFAVYVILGAVGLGLNELLMWAFTGKAGIYYMLSKVIVTAIVGFYNFASRKLFLEKLA